MESNSEKRYELISQAADEHKQAYLLGRKRLLVGRAESCDIVLHITDVSPIHAVIDLSGEIFRIFDMNSKRGTYVNGRKIVAEAFKLDDVLKFGSHEFHFKEYLKDDLPPALDMLEVGALPAKVKLPGAVPSVEKIDVPAVEYPLAADPKAEYSEYIFEDVDTLYPIFKYKIEETSVEIVILYCDDIYSVDYLPNRNGKFYLVHDKPSSDEIELPCLDFKKKFNFVEIQNKEIFVNSLPGYKTFYLSKNQEHKAQESYFLNDDDILCFSKGAVQIFVRRADSPPKVLAPPVLGRDRELIKYLLGVFIVLTAFLTTMVLFKVDKKIEEEKNPERIATILYRPEMKIPKRIIEKEVRPHSKRMMVAKKPTTQKKVIKKKTVTVKKKAAKKTPVPKPRPTVKKTVTKRPPKRAVKKVTTTTPTPKKGTARKKARIVPKRGHVDTYKSVDFSSSISNLMAKGSGKKVKTAVSGSIGDKGLPSVEGGETGELVPAKVTQEVGSLAKAASGTLDEEQDLVGLVDKKKTYSMGILEKTISFGMDPGIIRRILMNHLSQFRQCYQRVLDQSPSLISGILPLRFSIGASGHVATVGLFRGSSVPVNIQKCVFRVLKGIKFPSPPGGGRVAVNQPMNFKSR